MTYFSQRDPQGFSSAVSNQKVIYLDTAATSQKPACVLEAERDIL